MPVQSTQTRHPELPAAEFIFGSTAGMRDLKERIESALHDDLPVLIEGESGTGKEIIGRFLHDRSFRSEGPFLKVNCAAVPTNLAEREMFGYEKNSGSMQETKAGSIDLASGGTLFLDEIGDLDMSVQLRLARTIKSGRFRRLDGTGDQATDCRFVCATSRDLEMSLRNETAHQDLVDGLSHHRLRLLPLRERKEDIPLLCEYLLKKFARDFGRSEPRLSLDVLRAFQQWKWPGNIRELENWIARIVVFGSEEAIGLEFRRQLLAWQDSVPRQHRVSHLRLSRARRIRRRS